MKSKDFIENLYRIIFYYEELDQIMKIVEMYPVTMQEMRNICRLAAIIDAERGPGFSFKLLKHAYVKYHNWINKGEQ